MRNQVDIPDGLPLMPPGCIDGALTVNPAAIGQLRHQGGPIDGDRQDFALHIQDLGQGLHAGGKTAGVTGEHGQQHVAGIVAFQTTVFFKPLLKNRPGHLLMGT